MDSTAEAAAGAEDCNNRELSSPIAKGKRTKRLRLLSPIPITITPPFDQNTTNHPSPSSDESTTTEEEDTARCLILLANGHFSPTKRPTSKPVNRAASGYACKTCDRVFPSFQALGGHRASHKKPKNDRRSSSASLFVSDEEDFPSPSISSYNSKMSLSLQLNTVHAAASPRVHECSYCGAEFSSGQALGGHMRRHRAAGPITPYMSKPPIPRVLSREFEFEFGTTKEAKNGLSLDLNLPAPEDEHQR